MSMNTVKNSRILIIDDEHSNVVVLRAVLEQAGYRHISHVSDARRALEMIAHFDPDLILLDLQMERLNGIEVMEKIVAVTPENVFLPVIVLTADAQERARKEALEAGASDFLTKPFEI